MPGCNATTMLIDGIEHALSYLERFPFKDETTCEAETEKLLEALAIQLLPSLNANCSEKLFRSYFKLLNFTEEGEEGYEPYWVDLPISQAEIEEVVTPNSTKDITDFICPEANSLMLSEAFAWVDDFMENSTEWFENGAAMLDVLLTVPKDKESKPYWQNECSYFKENMQDFMKVIDFSEIFTPIPDNITTDVTRELERFSNELNSGKEKLSVELEIMACSGDMPGCDGIQLMNDGLAHVVSYLNYTPFSNESSCNNATENLIDTLAVHFFPTANGNCAEHLYGSFLKYIFFEVNEEGDWDHLFNNLPTEMEIKEELQNYKNNITEMICPILDGEIWPLLIEWVDNVLQTVNDKQWGKSAQVVVGMLLHNPDAVESKPAGQSNCSYFKENIQDVMSIFTFTNITTRMPLDDYREFKLELERYSNDINSVQEELEKAMCREDMPGCTAKYLIKEGMDHIKSYLQSFPFQNQGTCENETEKFVETLAVHLFPTANGNCADHLYGYIGKFLNPEDDENDEEEEGDRNYFVNLPTETEIKEEIATQNITNYITEMICPETNSGEKLNLPVEFTKWLVDFTETVNDEWIKSGEVVVGMLLRQPESVESKPADQSECSYFKENIQNFLNPIDFTKVLISRIPQYASAGYKIEMAIFSNVINLVKQMHYKMLVEVVCSGDDILLLARYEPHYLNYSSDSETTFEQTIRAPEGQQVEYVIVRGGTEECCDGIEVESDGAQIHNVGGYGEKEISFVSTNGELTVIYQSNDSVGQRGYEAFYRIHGQQELPGHDAAASHPVDNVAAATIKNYHYNYVSPPSYVEVPGSDTASHPVDNVTATEVKAEAVSGATSTTDFTPMMFGCFFLLLLAQLM